MSTKSKPSLYTHAGIHDLAEFYAARYASDELLHAKYFSPINRFDIRWARTMWVYDNVRRGSKILDLGCGAGVLAVLKRKDVTLLGFDLALQCADTARTNGYDSTCVGDLLRLPFADASFDYVVSLDVLGHIELDLKHAVIAEIRRVLKPDGVTMHGIECLDRKRRKDYEDMSEEELRQYVSIDGHVGMEDRETISERFGAFFEFVETHYRFSVCQSHGEFLKQSDDYGRDYCDEDFLAYLKQMSFKERRAFDMAMGYVFDRISEAELELPQSEYIFLKASNRELGSFYNEHRDRSDLQMADSELIDGPLVLDFAPQAAFDSGWYAAESFPPIARWMANRASVSFHTPSVSKVRLQLQSHLPAIETEPVTLKFSLNDVELSSVLLDRYGWIEVDLVVPELSSQAELFTFQIEADRVWQPKLVNSSSTDDRELSIAVCNLEVFP